MEMNDFIAKFEDVFEDTDISMLTPETCFRDLEEWTSMTALATMAMVSEEYDVELTPEDIRNACTFEDLFSITKSYL